MTTSNRSPLSPEQVAALHEASDVLCAANHSLKIWNGIVEAYIHIKGEDDGYTYCDQSGDYYCLRKALIALQEFIRANGLQMDDVR